MYQYNFSTLNDKDLEVLARDLLTRELSIPFQNFKVGKDKGADLRFSTNSSENEIVVQVKHYLVSGYKKLLTSLKKERDKISQLYPIPERYLLITSIGLSHANKEEIKKLLTPYIKNTNDIYGSDDLNRLLVKHNDLESKHFKLWFSNTKVIEKILNNGIEGRSAFIEAKIKKNLGLYVINDAYHNALNILRKQKILLITGIPGIGKTTLAYLITYYLLSKDFKLVYIDEKIREAEDLFNEDISVKQLFFFDDFLGSSYLEIINSRNSDKSLPNFIERIKSTPNKYFLLTTRSTILNQAIDHHEKLSRTNLEPLKYEIEVNLYNTYDKAKILYNHLFFNDLDEDMLTEVFKDKNYWKIIEHPNYQPRLIESFTKKENIEQIHPENYLQFIIYNLDHPDQIWDMPFKNQLNDSERFILMCLFSFGRHCFKNNLELAFECRIKYEIDNNGFTRTINLFNRAFKNLLGGYITNTIRHRNISMVDFINPSLKDYLINFFNENKSQKWDVIESFVYIEQFLTIFSQDKTKGNVRIENYEISRFLTIANSKKLLSIYCKDTDNVKLRIANLNIKYLNENNIKEVNDYILSILNEIVWDEIKVAFFYDLFSIIEDAEENSNLYHFIEINWDILIEKLITIVDQDSEMGRIKGLFLKYNIQYENYIFSNPNIVELINNAVNKIFENEYDNIFDTEKYDVRSVIDLKNLEDKVTQRSYELSNSFLNGSDIQSNYDPLKYIDLDELIEENTKTIDAEFNGDEFELDKDNTNDYTEAIDDLFSNIHE